MATRNGSNGNGSGALSLRSWAEEAQAAYGIAQALAPTAFVPEHLRVFELDERGRPRDGKDGRPAVLDLDGTVQQVSAVLLAGQELEFGPMASLRAFVLIRGQVALYAVAARALLQRRGHDIVVTESTSTRAIVQVRRAGTDTWQQATWDLDRARTAGLYPGKPEGNWRKNPKAMLVARASAEGARWVASDAMLGLPYIAEELEDAEVEVFPELEPPAAEPESTSGTATTTKARTTTARRKSPARAALPRAAPPPPDPGPPAPEQEPEPPPGEKPSAPQLAKLHAGLRDIAVTGKEEGLALISVWAGRTVKSTKSLTQAELHTALERLDSIRSAAAADKGEEVPPDDEPERE